MITDFWGNPIVEKKGSGPSRLKRAEYRQRYYYSPKGQANNNKTSRRWKARNPEKVKIYNRNSHLKRKYNLTTEEHKKMLETQGFKCAICRTSQWGGRHNLPHTDHDHTTGKVRGLLCHRCNHGLGYFGDDPALLEAAIKYLKGAKEAR